MNTPAVGTLTAPNISVRVATTKHVDFAAVGQIDGITLADLDFVLVRHQDDPAANGIYQFNANTLVRKDYPESPGGNAFVYETWPGAFPGTLVTVRDGFTFRHSEWICVNEPSDAGFTATNSNGAVYFVNTEPDFWRGANTADAIATQMTLQEHLDMQLSFDTPDHLFPFNVSVYPGTTFTVIKSHNACVVRCYVPTGVTCNVTLLNTNVSANFKCIFVLTGWGKLTFTATPPPSGGIPDLVNRYTSQKITFTTANGWKYTSIDYPSSGGIARLAGGDFKVTGDGLKLHPLVSMRGSGLGVTFLGGDSNLEGKQDPTQVDLNSGAGALLTILARTPKKNADPPDMSQPTIQDITFRGNSLLKDHIAGCIIEAGRNDPYHKEHVPPPPGSPDYNGGSANLYNVGFYSFKQWGVLCDRDRQRFHCLYARCTGNNYIGLELRGNDVVVGERCGFGGNGSVDPNSIQAEAGWGIFAGNISGVLLEGVNVFSAAGGVRNKEALALCLKSCNGASIVNCVFNDTVVVTGGDQLGKGIEFTGCSFKPNGIFTPEGPPIWDGEPEDEADYDCFIRVENQVNVCISGSTFCNNQNTEGSGVFKYHLIADDGSHVSYSASMIPNGAPEPNYRNSGALALPCLAAGGATICAELHDLHNGRQYSFVIKDSVSSGIGPVVRGKSRLNATYDGFSGVDEGRLLQIQGPELAAASGAMVIAPTGNNCEIPAGVSCAVIDLINKTGTVTFKIKIGQLSALGAQSYFPMRITIIRGTSGITLDWQKLDGSALPVASGSGQLKSTGAFSGSITRLSYELLYDGSTYYILEGWNQLP